LEEKVLMDNISLFNKAAAAAAFETSAYVPSQLIPSDKPEIVFSGKSNVGKSSMINRLVSRKGLAKVSSEPGKTASINFYDCGFFRLVDLPGYGYAKVSKKDKEKWSELIEGYFGQNRNIKLVVQLVDVRREPSQDDVLMLDYLTQNNLPFVVALTKTDKLKATQLAKRKIEVPKELSFCSPKIIFTSADNGMGIDELKSEIVHACYKNNLEDGE